MLVTCGWVAKAMEELAPLSFALEYDNVGLIVGERENIISKVMVALDITDSVVDEAVENGVGLVVTHHSPIHHRSPLIKITSDDALGRRLLKLLRNGIAVYTAHTNYDIARGGLNDILADKLGLVNREPLDKRYVPEEGLAIGRVGDLKEECAFSALAQRVKSMLGLQSVTVVGSPERIIRRVGLCSGSGTSAELIAMAKAAGCDAYIAGDLTYHNAQAAKDLDIALIDSTHYGSEVIMVKAVKDFLEARIAEQGVELAVLDPKADTQVMLTM